MCIIQQSWSRCGLLDHFLSGSPKFPKADPKFLEEMKVFSGGRCSFMLQNTASHSRIIALIWVGGISVVSCQVLLLLDYRVRKMT